MAAVATANGTGEAATAPARQSPTSATGGRRATKVQANSPTLTSVDPAPMTAAPQSDHDAVAGDRRRADAGAARAMATATSSGR
jgi:hypothetical protein